MNVLKFGGTSVGSAESILNVKQIVSSRQESVIVVVSALGGVREHRGRQELYKSLQPATLEKLCEVAKIQSTGASNRIENISTSEVRLRELMQRKSEPANRDEREIAGYSYVLDMIHERHDSIPVTPGVILQLHRDLYRFCDVSFAGRWKDSDNVVA